MSEQQTEPLHDPTPAEAMAISMAGAEAAQQASTPQEAEQKLSQAVEEKARELRVTLDPDASKAVAREVISQLDSMGAFRQYQDDTESEVEHTSGGQEEEQEASAAVEPPAPKKNWIQRLVSDD